MMTFKEAANMHKKYVCATYDQETQRKLREWCENYFFDLTVQFNGEYQDPEDFDFHTTIFYTDNEVSDEHDGVYTLDVDYPVQVTGYELLGENKDIPVLNVEGPMLRWIRENFEEKGFTDSWPEWKPHVSLSYAGKYGGLLPMMPRKLPDFPLTFQEFKCETQQM